MQRFAGRRGQAAQVPPRAHGADEDAPIIGMRLHADAIAQDGAAGEGRAGVHRQDTHLQAALAQQAHQPIDQRALPGARRPGQADDGGTAGLPIERAEQRLVSRQFVLYRGDSTSDGPDIATPHAVGQGFK